MHFVFLTRMLLQNCYYSSVCQPQQLKAFLDLDVVRWWLL